MLYRGGGTGIKDLNISFKIFLELLCKNISFLLYFRFTSKLADILGSSHVLRDYKLMEDFTYIDNVDTR